LRPQLGIAIEDEVKATSATAPTAAVSGRIEQALDFAQARGHIAEDRRSPAHQKGLLDKLRPKRPKSVNHPALPYPEVPAFMARVRQRGEENPVAHQIAEQQTDVSALRLGRGVGGRLEPNAASSAEACDRRIGESAGRAIHRKLRDQSSASRRIRYASVSSARMAITRAARSHGSLAKAREADGAACCAGAPKSAESMRLSDSESDDTSADDHCRSRGRCLNTSSPNAQQNLVYCNLNCEKRLAGCTIELH
jgi:hypothetical protein